MSDASVELDRLLIRSTDQSWLLLHEDGDAIAYFSVCADNSESDLPSDHSERGPNVQADISGRHFYDDPLVVSILARVQKVVGGIIRDDDDNEVTVDASPRY